MTGLSLLLWIFIFCCSYLPICLGNYINIRKVHNNTLAGIEHGCLHRSPYFVTMNVRFPMCMGQTDVDLKNGMSIINLINSRGYLPTCRILHFLLWMASEVHHGSQLPRDYFVDVGANIGSCTVHMAALGFPVISVEPVREHVNTIQGSININPAFHIELNHIGMSSAVKHVKVNFGHGARNWGASEFHEVGANETFELELQLKTLDQVVNARKVSLMKVDCEGCEWETLKGAKRSLKRIPMIKMELVQPSYTAGNETVSAYDIIQFLNASHYDLFYDHFNEQNLYFGKHGNQILDIDRLFGSEKFKLPSSVEYLHETAKTMLVDQIAPQSFDQRQFLKKATDIIAIDRQLANRMKEKWLGIPVPLPSGARR